MLLPEAAQDEVVYTSESNTLSEVWDKTDREVNFTIVSTTAAKQGNPEAPPSDNNAESSRDEP